MDWTIHLVNVFTCNGQGGNLAPIVLDAEGLTDAAMQEVARRYERESSFVTPAHEDSKVDFQLRFFVPEHEMEMCGHATVGTAWLMHTLGTTSNSALQFSTKSGSVSTHCTEENGQVQVFVSQPQGTVTDISDDTLVEEILSVLGIQKARIAQWPVQNACTSRVKTVIPLKDAHILNNLRPDFSKVKDLCERLGSTGLYPYAVVQHDRDPIEIEARQFPKASGYPEDAATGIAAAALSYALAANRLLRPGQKAVIYQGRVMGCLSEINVQLDQDGCWIGGACRLESRSE